MALGAQVQVKQCGERERVFGDERKRAYAVCDWVGLAFHVGR